MVEFSYIGTADNSDKKIPVPLTEVIDHFWGIAFIEVVATLLISLTTHLSTSINFLLLMFDDLFFLSQVFVLCFYTFDGPKM